MGKTNTTPPSGTRDFLPIDVLRRKHVVGIIEKVYQSYGFEPLETPTMERIETLLGKYGEEGDQLIFKVLNSGDFLAGTGQDDFNRNSKELVSKISNKGLRYDLTVPLARYIVANRGTITLPFRRYQIQPVWRADRPQRGRYREFVQCDVDIIGTDSLICEAELIQMTVQILATLGIADYTIKLNSRKILAGINQDPERNLLFDWRNPGSGRLVSLTQFSRKRIVLLF